MQTVVDLHSHSGYAGGVGQIELSTVAAAMKMKGINIRNFDKYAKAAKAVFTKAPRPNKM